MILPGFPMLMMGGEKAPFLVASSSTTSLSEGSSASLSIPTSVMVGDLVVVCAGAIGNSSGYNRPNVPSGMQQIYLSSIQGIGQPGYMVCWKILTQGDINVGSFTISYISVNPSSMAAIAQFWRNAGSIGSGTNNRTGESGQTASINIQNNGNGLALFALTNSYSTGVPVRPDPPSESKNDITRVASTTATQSNARCTSYYEEKLQSGATGTRVWGAGSSRVFAIQIMAS